MYSLYREKDDSKNSLKNAESAYEIRAAQKREVERAAKERHRMAIEEVSYMDKCYQTIAFFFN